MNVCGANTVSFYPCLPSVRGIRQDESQKKLKPLATPVSLFVLKYKTAQVRLQSLLNLPIGAFLSLRRLTCCGYCLVAYRLYTKQT